MKNFLLTVATVMAFGFGASAQVLAPQVYSEMDPNLGTIDNLELYLSAELQDSVKIIVSNADMLIDASHLSADLQLDGAGAAAFTRDGHKLAAKASRTAAACHNEGGLIAYAVNPDTTAVDTTCTFIAGGAGTAQFATKFHLEVEKAGPTVVNIEVVRETNPLNLMGSAFTDGQIASVDNDAVVISTDSVEFNGLEHADKRVINWSGKAPFDGGPAFEDKLTVEITLL